MHELHGHPSPLARESLVWRAYAGAKRMQCGEAREKQRLPITVELLIQLERWQDMTTADGRLIRAAMWLGTCGLLRSGEFTVRNQHCSVVRREHLAFRDEEGRPLNPSDTAVSHMSLQLLRSKTDQFGASPAILIAQPNARSAMLAYLSRASDLRAEDPLLRMADGRPLTYAFLMRHTHALLLAAGVEDIARYKGHSFRRGGATSLHLAGQADSVIKAMGRWRSFTFATYVDTPRAVLLIMKAGRAMAGEAAKGKSVTRTFAARQHAYETWIRPVWEEDNVLSCARPSLA